jgi:hypothetical protein
MYSSDALPAPIKCFKYILILEWADIWEDFDRQQGWNCLQDYQVSHTLVKKG